MLLHLIKKELKRYNNITGGEKISLKTNSNSQLSEISSYLIKSKDLRWVSLDTIAFRAEFFWEGGEGVFVFSTSRPIWDGQENVKSGRNSHEDVEAVRSFGESFQSAVSWESSLICFHSYRDNIISVPPPSVLVLGWQGKKCPKFDEQMYRFWWANVQFLMSRCPDLDEQMSDEKCTTTVFITFWVIFDAKVVSFFSI